MMALVKADRPTLDDVLASLVDPDVGGNLDELSDALVLASSLLARLRRRRAATLHPETEIPALEEVVARSIALTRGLRDRLQGYRARGDYTSLSHVARDVVGHLQGVIPDEVTLAVVCPTSPAVVAGARSEIRRVLVAVLEAALAAIPAGGSLDVEVSERTTCGSSPPGRAVRLEVRCSGHVDAGDPRIEERARPIVHAVGGAIAIDAERSGGTAIRVRFRGVC